MKPGDPVLCIKLGPWFHTKTHRNLPGPVAGQVLTILTINSIGYLLFEGYLPAYKPDRFIPLSGPVTCKAKEKRRAVPVPA
jgi:hypothetical protein